MKLSTVTLSYFAEVCRENGFSPAAIKLGKSQSAVSTQIGLLEKELGLKLFDRSKRPLLVTEAGRAFFDFATEVLNRSEEFERYLSELSSGIAGEVKIGASTSVGTYILPGILSRLLRRYPKLQISLSTQPRSAVFESVRRADVDFGLVLSDKPPEGLAVRTLKTERLCLIISPKHALTKRRRLKMTDLGTVPFVVGPKGTEYTEMITRVLANNHLFGYGVAARISNFEGVKDVVRAGLGVGLLPHFMLRKEIRARAIRELKIAEFDASASIMCIERLQHLSTPTIVLVKDFLTAAVVSF
jgi:DNA-binding transcriptional LysR family regulator